MIDSKRKNKTILLYTIAATAAVVIVLIMVLTNGISEEKQDMVLDNIENNITQDPTTIDEEDKDSSDLPILDSSPEIPVIQATGNGNTVTKISNGELTAIQNDRIYFVSDDDGKIYTINIDGGGLSKINDDSSSNINVIGDWIFYINHVLGSYGKIYAIKTDGTERQEITDKTHIIRLIVAGDWVYYITQEDRPQTKTHHRSLYAIKPDGSGLRKMTDDYVVSMFIDDDRIYYRDENANLYSLRTDGSERYLIGDKIENPSFVIDGWIYYTTGIVGDSIWAIMTDGSEKRKIDDAKVLVTGIKTDGERIYYSNSDDDYKLYSIKFDGSENQKITDDRTYSISVISDWIFYDNITGRYWDAPYFQLFAIKTDGTERHLVGYEGISIGLINSPEDEVEIRESPDITENSSGFLVNNTEIAIKGKTNGFYIIGGWGDEDLYISTEFVDIIG